MRTIVTGASSGIGRELALELARGGARLIVTARREERLQGLLEALSDLEVEAHAVVGDIVEPTTREALLAAVQEHFSGLDTLVNNAGIGALGPFVDADEERLRRIMEVNFFAPLELIRLVVPMLRSGRRPLIANIGSVLGHRAVPKKSEYCASKFAMHGFSDALRCELASDGIDVLLVSPSTTSSEFFEHAIDREGAAPTFSWATMSPQAVARKVVRAIQRGKHEIILTPGGKLLVWLDRLCPPVMNRLLARFG
jgi:short-subunit dehydrogenase